MMRIAMIGYGAIGRYVAAWVEKRTDVVIMSALCRPGREATAAVVFGPDVTFASRVQDLDLRALDLAVDCAGHQGLNTHGPSLLEAGIDVITVSTGALADPILAETLEQAAKRGKAQLELLAGAVGAIDALAAARRGGLESVTFRAEKPPLGWRGTPAEDVIDLDGLTEPAVHFEGSARDAASRYPKNANVAATVAIAGLGLDDTKVVLIADPTLNGNRHRIEAEGAFGRLTLQIDGKALPDNPKSSALTAMSVTRALANRVQPIRL